MRLLGLPVPERRAAALARVGAIVEEPRFHRHLTGRENLRIVAAARGRDAYGADRRLARAGRARRPRRRSREDLLARHAAAPRHRPLPARRSRAADPRRADERPRPGRHPGVPRLRSATSSAEGRTIVLSSHLLDEVEKTCDHVAIVDGGTIVAQGGVEEIASSGDPTLLIEVDDEAAARHVLERSRRDRGGSRCVARQAHRGGCSAAEINRALVVAGHRRVAARARTRDARGDVPRDHVATGGKRMRPRPRRGAEARPAARAHGVVADPHGRGRPGGRDRAARAARREQRAPRPGRGHRRTSRGSLCC